jgi:uncharacterized protein YutE (UPF0331/DUF86 family)
MTLNADLVRSRCADIEDAVVRLERFGAMPAEEFTGNPEQVDAACYRLLVGVEAAIALCYHISATHLRQVPEQYAACFDTLREAGILSDDLATRLKAMTRFRNLLVHMYKKVEPAAIHAILRESLPDLRAFAAAIVGLR